MKTRKSSRLILINEREEVFLFLYDYTEWDDQYHLWITPGGGAEPGETEEETLRREIAEELGIAIDEELPMVYTQERVLRHPIQGELLSSESYFLMYCNRQDFDYQHWTVEERECMTAGKWWSQEELDRSGELFFTERVGDWFRAVRNYKNGGYGYSQGVEFTELQMKLADFSLTDVIEMIPKQSAKILKDSMRLPAESLNVVIPETKQETEAVTFRYAKPEDFPELQSAVKAVDPDWVQFFTSKTKAFLAVQEGKIVGFTILDNPDRCILSREHNHFGAVGCVGVVPSARDRGIGLAMVARATEEIQKMGCTHCAIHYTYLEQWYQKLGYRTYQKYCFCNPNVSNNGYR